MDPQRTQAEWNDLFDRFSVLLKGDRLLRPIQKLFERSDRVFVWDEDPLDNCSNWDLSGVIPGVNTTAAGLLYVRTAANGGNWDIHVYKAVSAANEVANATDVADGATATLSAANSSGITGTVLLDGSMAADTSDTHILHCFSTLPAVARYFFDGTEQEDAATLRDFLAACQTAYQRIEDARRVLADVAKGSNFLAYMARILKVNRNQGLLSTGTANDDGVVTLDVSGLVEDLRDCMQSNTSGGALEQHVPAHTLASGTVVYPTRTGGGTGVLTAGTPAANMLPGTVTLKCVDETLGSEEFEVSYVSTDGELSLVGQNNLQVTKAWTDPAIQVALSFARTYAKTGDAGNTDFAAATGCIFTGITSSNSDDGVLYAKVTGSTGAWTYYFYKASSRQAADLVAQSSAVAAGGAYVATQQNRSGLSVAWTAGSAPTTGNTASIDCQPFKTSAPGLAANQAYFPITRSTARSEWQEAIRERFNWYLNDDNSPTIAEAVLMRGADLFPNTADE